VRVAVKGGGTELSSALRRASPGDEIILDKGEYRVDGLEVEVDVTLKGGGVGATKLVFDGYGFICEGVRRFRVEGVSMVSLGEAEVLNVKYGRVEATNCEFTGCLQASLRVEMGLARIVGCRFHGNGYGALLCEGSVISVERCEFSRNEVAALWVKGGDLKVERCVFQENMLGIGAAWGSRIKVVDNEFVSHVVDPAVVVMEKSDAELRGNMFYDCRCGILLTRYSTATIEGNVFIMCGDGGNPVVSVGGDCSVRGRVADSNKFVNPRGDITN